MAGALDLLLDLQLHDGGTPAGRQRATGIARLLKESARVPCGRTTTWASERRDWISPGLWVGFLGPACALARWVAYTDGNSRWMDELI